MRRALTTLELLEKLLELGELGGHFFDHDVGRENVCSVDDLAGDDDGRSDQLAVFGGGQTGLQETLKEK